MELAALVALGLAAVVFGLAGAELAEVLGRLGNYIFEQFHLDPAQLLPWLLMSVTGVGSGVRGGHVHVHARPHSAKQRRRRVEDGGD